jgi:hypothetical protein
VEAQANRFECCGWSPCFHPGENDLLKIDIEGAEYDVLGSADAGILARIRRITLEFHPTAGDTHRWPVLKQQLISAGFRLVSESDDGARARRRSNAKALPINLNLQEHD